MDSIFNKLEKILEERKSASSDQSYVSSLYSKGTSSILDKISEESEEVINAVNEEGRKEVIQEVADLWFHTLVLLSHLEEPPSAVLAELERRLGVSGLLEKASRGNQND